MGAHCAVLHLGRGAARSRGARARARRAARGTARHRHCRHCCLTPAQRTHAPSTHPPTPHPPSEKREAEAPWPKPVLAPARRPHEGRRALRRAPPPRASASSRPALPLSLRSRNSPAGLRLPGCRRVASVARPRPPCPVPAPRAKPARARARARVYERSFRSGSYRVSSASRVAFDLTREIARGAVRVSRARARARAWRLSSARGARGFLFARARNLNARPPRETPVASHSKSDALRTLFGPDRNGGEAPGRCSRGAGGRAPAALPLGGCAAAGNPPRCDETLGHFESICVVILNLHARGGFRIARDESGANAVSMCVCVDSDWCAARVLTFVAAGAGTWEWERVGCAFRVHKYDP